MSVRRSVTAITLGPLSAHLIVAALLLLALFAMRAPSAFAHAAFLDSTPEAGARLRSSPPQIRFRFTEPLNRSLSKASIVDAKSGRRIETAELRSPRSDELVLRTVGRLPRAPYRVNWHTVSTVDGHALEGSFSFGVRTAAVGSEHQVHQSPLARNGWIRIAFRLLFYAALFIFAGGLLNSLLHLRGEPAGWLVPPEVRSSLDSDGRDADGLAARAWARTLDAGWLAAGAAAGTALAEAADAGGSLTIGNLNDYLLTNTAGLARVGTVIALTLAVLCANRLRVAAGVLTVAALLAVAISGHANSANPRAGAVLTDWIHLVAGSVWIGGIAQLAAIWIGPMRSASQNVRSAVMRSVLNRFGRVALPAFGVVLVSGSLNALIELGHVQALWQTAYGRVLALKIALVALVALASYSHALRIRPRLLAANPHTSRRLERRHWSLLSAEPLLAIGIVAAAATLVAFPLPPRQLGEAGRAEAGGVACNSCPLRAPRPGELAVADQAGSNIAAFWLRHNGDKLSGEVRLLDANLKPVDAPLRLLGGGVKSCGIGCWRFEVAGAAEVVTVAVEEKGKEYRASVPARWDLKGNEGARRLTELAQGTMRGLRSVREDERLTSGPGTNVRTLYRLRAPHRFAYRTSSGASSIVIGKRQWNRVAGEPWQAQPFGGITAFRTRGFFRWTVYARAARLLRTYEEARRRIAVVALMDPATPVWFRLYVDLSTNRVRADRMVTGAHFMNRRYFGFNAPVRVDPPRNSVPPR
jgi:copper transport protein